MTRPRRVGAGVARRPQGQRRLRGTAGPDARTSHMGH